MADHKTRLIEDLRPHIERARGFSGWSFTELQVRHLDARVPWDYEAIVRERAARASSVLDLGTGGGEVLARIVPHTSARVVASEEWVRNVPAAAERLRPLGVEVIHGDSTRLPFRSASFELVIDRHEALDPHDVARVVAPGGMAITQQVGPDSWPELRRFFPRKQDFGDHFNDYQRGFAAGGLTIEQARWHEERVAFERLGDLVYILLVAPWTIPGFDPIAEIDDLLLLEDELRTPDGIVLTEMHYIIIASRLA